MSISVRWTERVTQAMLGSEASVFWPSKDDEEVGKENRAVVIYYFLSLISCAYQLIKSKPHYNHGKSVCLTLFVQIGKWTLREIK